MKKDEYDNYLSKMRKEILSELDFDLYLDDIVSNFKENISDILDNLAASHKIKRFDKEIIIKSILSDMKIIIN